MFPGERIPRAFQLLPDGMPVGWVDGQGRSLVYHAVEQLVQAESSMYTGSERESKSEFLIAFLKGLIQMGASPNAGLSALVKSVELTKPDVATLLIEAGAHVEAMNNGYTALALAFAKLETAVQTGDAKQIAQNELMVLTLLDLVTKTVKWNEPETGNDLFYLDRAIGLRNMPITVSLLRQGGNNLNGKEGDEPPLHQLVDQVLLSAAGSHSLNLVADG